MTSKGELLKTLLDESPAARRRRLGTPVEEDPVQLAWELIGSRGEASGVAMAERLLSIVEAMDADGRRAFFETLRDEFDVETEAARKALEEYSVTNAASALLKARVAVESKREVLFRRLNTAPGGTARLVWLRGRLLELVRHHRGTDGDLSKVDNDLKRVLEVFFNRGFLVLRRIDWRSSAEVLEKIINYEAVHEITSWTELRSRLAPADRAMFGFFHPSLPDEPLIFVEVALTKGIKTSIRDVLDDRPSFVDPSSADTALFYSIQSCQPGLVGVHFGAFLIKQVAHTLTREYPNLTTFATLSPLPGFAEWLKAHHPVRRDGENNRDVRNRDNPQTTPPKADSLKKNSNATFCDDYTDAELKALAAQYLLVERRPNGEPLDPVARFHLGNGASLFRVNARADLSDRGLAASAGVMVNYRYVLPHIEDNHENYVQARCVAASPQAAALLSPAAKLKQQTQHACWHLVTDPSD